MPTDAARSPWSAEMQHGGPANALLARCAEEAVADAGLQAARLTVDLFRPVPMQPLEARAEIVRRGRRIALVASSLVAGGEECARASALFLAAGERRPEEPAPGAGLPPGGLDAQPLVPSTMRQWVASGFHTHVEVAFDPREGRRVVWLRVPMPLVEGEPITPFQRVAAASDLTSPLGIRARATGPDHRGRYINTDTTVYFERAPAGEWTGFEHAHAHFGESLGVAEVTLSDARGPFGRSIQASLARPPPGR